MKRFFDIVSAGCGLVFLSPLLLGIAVAIKLSSKGRVLYWSERMGRENRPFSMPKFRTMRVDTPEIGAHLLPGTENWVTPIGGFLRRTSLDELPQLWSILVGRMSVVGPRPLLGTEEVMVALRTLRGVHHLKPGLTGWAQVNGRANLIFSEKLEYDIYYLKNQSVWFDLKVVLKTIFVVLGRQGINRGGDPKASAVALPEAPTAPVERDEGAG